MFFLGYPNGIKGYRLWDREFTVFKIITSRDVTFDESNMPCRQNKEPNGLTKVEERSRTKLQIELGLPTDLVVPE